MCPDSISSEVIKKSLEKIKSWRHPMEKSLTGNRLYSKTTMGEVKHFMDELNRQINAEENVQMKEGEKE